MDAGSPAELTTPYPGAGKSSSQTDAARILLSVAYEDLSRCSRRVFQELARNDEPSAGPRAALLSLNRPFCKVPLCLYFRCVRIHSRDARNSPSLAEQDTKSEAEHRTDFSGHEGASAARTELGFGGGPGEGPGERGPPEALTESARGSGNLLVGALGHPMVSRWPQRGSPRPVCRIQLCSAPLSSANVSAVSPLRQARAGDKGREGARRLSPTQ